MSIDSTKVCCTWRGWVVLYVEEIGSLYVEEVGVLYVEELGSFVRRGARCVVRRGARCFVRGGATVGWPTGARRAPFLLPVSTPEGRAGERPE